MTPREIAASLGLPFKPSRDKVVPFKGTPESKARALGWAVNPEETSGSPHAFRGCNCKQSPYWSKFGCGCPCHGAGGALIIAAEMDGT